MPISRVHNPRNRSVSIRRRFREQRHGCKGQVALLQFLNAPSCSRAGLVSRPRVRSEHVEMPRVPPRSCPMLTSTSPRSNPLVLPVWQARRARSPWRSVRARLHLAASGPVVQARRHMSLDETERRWCCPRRHAPKVGTEVAHCLPQSPCRSCSPQSPATIAAPLIPDHRRLSRNTRALGPHPAPA